MLPRRRDAQMADIAPIGKGVALGSLQDHTVDMVVVTLAAELFVATIIKLAALCFGRVTLQPKNVCDRG